MDSAPDIATPNRAKRRIGILLVILASLIFISLLSVIFSSIRSVPRNIKKEIDGISLRKIGQAIIAYGHDNSEGILPSDESLDQSFIREFPDRVRNIYTVALTLARADNRMNDPAIWFSKVDAIFPPLVQPPTVLDPAHTGDNRRAPRNPKFTNAPLALAVAIFTSGQGRTSLPATTPLAWTRGLQLDGTWSKTHGTYGDGGGFVVFMGGNVEKFKSIDGKLVKFGTNEPTSNILEALPPGSRISEFTPPKK